MMTRFPAFTGFPFGDRSYLVVVQDQNQLRPTGGEIVLYGVWDFNNGFSQGLEFQDPNDELTDHKEVELPLIISALLNQDEEEVAPALSESSEALNDSEIPDTAELEDEEPAVESDSVLSEDSNSAPTDESNSTTNEGWTFKDANFDPNFPTASQELLNFYELTNPEAEFDGVIAIDLHFIENWLDYYGDIYVEGQELSSENLFTTLASSLNQSQLLSSLLETLIKKSKILPWRVSAKNQLIAQALNEKHILATFTRARIDKIFIERNWQGALPQSDVGDFLSINEANFSLSSLTTSTLNSNTSLSSQSLPTNRYLFRDVSYELTLTDEKDVLGHPVIEAQLSITLSHEGGWNEPFSGIHNSYIRSMIPIGSDLSKGASISEDRDDVEVLGELIELLPGEEITLTYNYELPPYVWVGDTYFLHLHKQAGTLADSYRVLVHSSSADDSKSYTISSPQFEIREDLAIYETKLTTDQTLSFTLE